MIWKFEYIKNDKNQSCARLISNFDFDWNGTTIGHLTKSARRIHKTLRFGLIHSMCFLIERYQNETQNISYWARNKKKNTTFFYWFYHPFKWSWFWIKKPPFSAIKENRIMMKSTKKPNVNRKKSLCNGHKIMANGFA